MMQDPYGFPAEPGLSDEERERRERVEDERAERQMESWWEEGRR